MKKLLLVTVVFVMILGLFALAAHFWRARPDRLNYEYTPNMARTVAYKAQTANPFFANGRTEQPPVAGTIARGFMPLHYGEGEAEALRAGMELHNPYTGEKANLARGKQIYTSTCLQCHGAAGQGDGIVARRGFPPPPSLLLDNARQMQDGKMFYIITFGFKNMPAYGPQLAREDRWQVINYVRKLQESQQ